MPRLHDFFAYTIVEQDAGGMITGRLLRPCPTLEAVCQYLRRYNMAAHQVHVAGWDNAGGQWVIPTGEIERAMRGES